MTTSKPASRKIGLWSDQDWEAWLYAEEGLKRLRKGQEDTWEAGSGPGTDHPFPRP